MNGPAAARKIRELGCDTFICGVTGNVLPEDRTHFTESGANWIFLKPLDLSDRESVWQECAITSSRHYTKPIK